MMMGPSAPNGPPVPIDTARGHRFKMATFGSDQAAAKQDGLQRLRNAVAPDFLPEP